jgi:ribonuclease HI
MKNEILVFCDGGARGNPGPAAIGFVVWQNNKIVHKFSQEIGVATNNVAEYQAVITALEWLEKNPKIIHYPLSIIHFNLDSQLIVNQLNGRFKVKNSNLQKLIINVKNLEKKLGSEIIYQYISRRQNKVADALVNQVLNGL